MKVQQEVEQVPTLVNHHPTLVDYLPPLLKKVWTELTIQATLVAALTIAGPIEPPLPGFFPVPGF